MKILLLILLLVNTTSSAEMQKVSIQLLWLDQFQFAGYYIAKEKGYYKDVGLEVKIKKYNKDIDIVREVVSGNATYGVGRSSLIVDKSKGAKIKLLGAIFQSSPVCFLTLQKNNIKNINDFKGRKVMLPDSDLDYISLKAMVSKGGISDSDIIKLPHSFSVDDLVNHKTDIMLAYTSNEPFLLKEKGIRYKIFDPKDYGFDFYSDILFTSDSETVKNKRRVRSFTTASLKGWEYAFNHIDETIDLIQKKYNSQKKSKKALKFEAIELKKLAYYKNDMLGRIDRRKIQNMFNIYNLMNLVDRKIDLEEFVFDNQKHLLDFTPLEQEWLSKNQDINYVYDADWKPFEWKDETGAHQGIISDFLNIIASSSGINFVPVQTKSWNEAVSRAENGDVAMYSGVGKTKDRSKYMNFTEKNLISTPYVFVSRMDEDYFNGFSDTHNKIVSLGENSTIHNLIHLDMPKQKFVFSNDNIDGFKKLEDKEIDIFIINALSAKFYIKKYGFKNLKIAYKTKYTLDLKIAINKKMPKEVISILNKSIELISPKDIGDILHKWNTYTIDKTLEFELFVKILLAILVVLFIVLFHNYQLKKRVQVELDTNRKKDQLLMEQNRLAQMGEMLSMIAHQWRQPLNAINLTANNLNIKCMMDDIDKNYFQKELQLINNYSQHLSTTVDDFRHFFNKDKTIKTTNMENIVKETLSIIQLSSESKGIKFKTSFQNAQKIETYANEVKHVILNIIKNAQDILIENSIEYPEIYIGTDAKTLTIKDNAGGIPTDMMSKIFDPYFSTKMDKEGTGLGLYMSKTIIEEHCSGTLKVSNDDKGAVFTIQL